MNALTVSQTGYGAPFVVLASGDRCPRIRLPSNGRPMFAMDSLGGRYILVCLLLTASDPQGRSAVEAIARNRSLFDDDFATALTISIDPSDKAAGRIPDILPGVRGMWDLDQAVSRSLGALPVEPAGDGPKPARRLWLVIDPTLHVLAVLPFSAKDPEHQAVFDLVRRLPHPTRYGGQELPPPVLMLPNVFEPDLCRQLIDGYRQDGGAESGVMRGGAGVLDSSFKRRRDAFVTDEDILWQLHHRLRRRVIPEIERLFFAQMTRIERNIVGCYSAEEGGVFRAHRDNDPGLTGHRRFAVSINLNDDFEGGEVAFAEYSRRGYKAPAGWALIFPCNILHEVSRVRCGTRYAYLPFLYDEAGMAIRFAHARALEAAAEAAAAQCEAPVAAC